MTSLYVITTQYDVNMVRHFTRLSHFFVLPEHFKEGHLCKLFNSKWHKVLLKVAQCMIQGKWVGETKYSLQSFTKFYKKWVWSRHSVQTIALWWRQRNGRQSNCNASTYRGLPCFQRISWLSFIQIYNQNHSLLLSTLIQSGTRGAEKCISYSYSKCPQWYLIKMLQWTTANT